MGPKLRWRVVPHGQVHNLTMAVLVLVICTVSGYAFWLSFQQVAGIYLGAAERTVAAMHEDFLRLNVHNVVQVIERLKSEEEQSWEALIADRLQLLEQAADLDAPAFAGYFQQLMQSEPQLSALLWNPVSGEILYSQGELRLPGAAAGLQLSELLLHGELVALWGVHGSTLQRRVQAKVQETLATLELGEGMWLSVAQGPLRVDEHGNDLAYSLWHEELGWLVTMGVNRSELERHLHQTAQEGGRLTALLSLRLVLVLVLLVVAALGLVLVVEYFFFRQQTAQLKTEINEDLLTGARSRRCGVEILSRAFASFQAGEPSPVLLMFDVDCLKEVNDFFGHAAGDQVLRAVAAAVRRVVGSGGELIRWGGDEFVVVVSAELGERVQRRIMESVAALEFKFAGEKVTTGISLGAARFQPGDTGFMDALNRADAELYAVKRAGKASAQHTE